MVNVAFGVRFSLLSEQESNHRMEYYSNCLWGIDIGVAEGIDEKLFISAC